MDGTMTPAKGTGRMADGGSVQGRRHVLRLTGGAALMGAFVTGGMRAPHAVADTPGIVGAWFVNRSAAITNSPTTNLTRWTMVFMADGTLIAQIAPIGPSPAGMTLASIASGVWQGLPNGTFGFTHLHVRYDQQTGQAFGVSRWLGSVTLDPGADTFAISYRVNVLNPDTLATERSGEMLDGTGMRIALDPSLQMIAGQAVR